MEEEDEKHSEPQDGDQEYEDSSHLDTDFQEGTIHKSPSASSSEWEII